MTEPDVVELMIARDLEEQWWLEKVDGPHGRNARAVGAAGGVAAGGPGGTGPAGTEDRRGGVLESSGAQFPDGRKV